MATPASRPSNRSVRGDSSRRRTVVVAPDDETDHGQRADRHPGDLACGERRQGARMGPVRRHEEGRRPRERRHPARDEALLRPGVAAGAGPAVAEVVAAGDQRRDAQRHECRRPRQALALAAGQTREDAPHDGDGRQHGQGQEEHDGHRHHHHRRPRRRGVGLRPLPAHRQLRPHGDAEGEEDGQRAPQRRQARSRLFGGLERSRRPDPPPTAGPRARCGRRPRRAATSAVAR